MFADNQKNRKQEVEKIIQYSNYSNFNQIAQKNFPQILIQVYTFYEFESEIAKDRTTKVINTYLTKLFGNTNG